MTTVESILRELARPIGVREARLLVADAMGVRQEMLIAHPEKELSYEEEKRARENIARRTAGEPYPYIVGRQSFFGRIFKVTRDVLIPRPDTELIVEMALEFLSHIHGPAVLDLGTGSGCIAISIAKERPDAKVTATDLSPKALAVAEENANGASVEFKQGRWLQALSPEQRFDLIVANPPYIVPDSPYLQELSYEPRSALVAEPDGLADIREIIQGAPRYLFPNGGLMLEHGYDQGEACRKLMQEGGFLSVHTVLDLGGNDRVTAGIFPGNA